MIVLDPPDENWPSGAYPPGGPGQLLEKIITLGLGLTVPQVSVTPVLKCRPQSPELILQKTRKQCLRIILQEIELVRPRAVLAMGVTAAQILTESEKNMFFLRPKNFVLKVSQPVPLRITLGLDLMLAEPEMKKEVWGDLKKLMRQVNLK
jgi:DNA polymerase